MNERILALAEQAGYIGRGSNHTAYMNFDHETFAELIVAECLEACSRANEIRHFVPPSQQQVVLSCILEIEKTFRS